MADEALNEKWTKLVAIMERLANQPAPTVNVNVYTDSKKKRSDGVISGKEVGPHDIPDPGGQPRPYVS